MLCFFNPQHLSFLTHTRVDYFLGTLDFDNHINKKNKAKLGWLQIPTLRVFKVIQSFAEKISTAFF